VQVAIGRIHAARGNFDLSFAALERALAIDPNSAIANQAIAGSYGRQGRLEDAEAAYQRALALEPESLVIQDDYANFLFAQSRFDEAAEHWQTVIGLAPDHYVALVNLGSTLSQIGRIQEAIRMFEQAIKIRPSYMAYSNLGSANFGLQRYAAAEKALLKALEIDDTDWLAWGNLGFTYSWMQGADSPKAVETFTHAIELAEAAREQSSRDPFVYSDLALYYAKTGQRDLALQRVATAIALSSDTAEIVAAAVEVYEILGDRSKAIEYAKMSLRLGVQMQRLQRNPELSELLNDPQMLDLL
jgi:tetratricopeptide (TPR) repeat protein